MSEPGVSMDEPPLQSLPTVEELLEIDGVVATGEFTPDGSLVDYEASMEMSDDLAAMSAQFCASVTMLFDTLGGAFSEMSGMEGRPTGVGILRW